MVRSLRILNRRRQEDPISSYMFLLPAEGSSGFLKYRDQLSQIDGTQVAPSAPCINHLLFAYDSLLFFKASGLGVTEVSNRWILIVKRQDK